MHRLWLLFFVATLSGCLDGRDSSEGEGEIPFSLLESEEPCKRAGWTEGEGALKASLLDYAKKLKLPEVPLLCVGRSKKYPGEPAYTTMYQCAPDKRCIYIFIDAEFMEFMGDAINGALAHEVAHSSPEVNATESRCRKESLTEWSLCEHHEVDVLGMKAVGKSTMIRALERTSLYLKKRDQRGQYSRTITKIEIRIELLKNM